MAKHFFLLNCPRCPGTMKYHAETQIISDKRKRCVYCGKSFKIRENVLKELGVVI